MNVTNFGAVSTQTAAPYQHLKQNNGLGQDAFMKILVTQMKYQNPLEPLKDTEFIGQMAQFSSLEQLTHLNQAMNQLIAQQGKQSFMAYADLIGTIVYWEQEIDGQWQSGTGQVKALSWKNGELTAELEDDQIEVPVDSIQRIEQQINAKGEK